MKNLVIGFCFAAFGLAPLAGSAEEALFWRFDDPTVVRYHGDPISAHEIEGVNAIRVKAVDGGVESYLRLYAGDGTGFADLGDALAMSDNWMIEPLYAGLGEYSREGVKFMIEVGAYAGPDSWTALAYGSLADYGELVADYHIQEMTPLAMPATAWSGGVFMIPEPTGGLLMVFGFALLGLKRKKEV